VKSIKGDRKDCASVKRLVEGKRFDAAFDLSYAPTTGEDVDCFLRALGPQVHYIFCSSTSVYAREGRVSPIKEDFARQGWEGTYGRNKLESEDLLFARSTSGEARVTILRPTFVYGPQNPYYREAFFFDRISMERKVLLPAPVKAMQLVHVADLARAMVAALERDQPAGRAYNIAGSETLMQDEFVEEVSRAVGKCVQLVPFDRALVRGERESRMYFGASLDTGVDCVFDTTAAKRDLKFSATTSLADGLSQCHSWWLSHKEAYAKYVDFGLEDNILRRANA
jgi:nucleoside-diphosphate-sugar epimerase